jgi:hypothetical protein
MKFLLHKAAFISAGAGILLTFLLTVGKIIEPGILLGRYVVNIAIFYLLGAGIPWAWQKFIEPVLNAPEKSEFEGMSSADSASDFASKGPSSDAYVPSNGSASSEAVETVSAPSDSASAVPAKGKAHTDFEIQDDFIIIKDKKLPNDPKLMAEAIKTKLAE